MRGFVGVIFLIAAMAFLCAGCGLVADVFSFPFCTGAEEISVDSDNIGISLSGLDAIPDVSCNRNSDCVGHMVSCGGAGQYECTLACVRNKCEVHSSFVIGNTIDLSDKVKSNTTATILSKVTVERVEVEVLKNSLNFDMPEISLRVGPNAANLATDDGVRSFATIPTIEAEQTGTTTVTVTPAGKDAMAEFVKDYRTPFKLLADGSLVLKSGDPLPSGQLTATVKTCFKAEVF